jgi:hypothetical protein
MVYIVFSGKSGDDLFVGLPHVITLWFTNITMENHGTSACLMAKSTISMGMFNI